MDLTASNNITPDDQKQIDAISSQVQQVNPGFNDGDGKLVGNAFNFAKTQAEANGGKPTDLDYWDNISAMTKQSLQLPSSGKLNTPLSNMPMNPPPQPIDTTPKYQAPQVSPPQGFDPTGANDTSGISNPKTPNTTVAEARLRDKKVNELTDSSAFASTPVNASNKYTRGKTGPEINDEAKKRLDLFRKHGFGSSIV